MTDQSMFVGLVADAGEYLIVNEKLTGREKVFVPVVHAHRKAVARQESNRTVPQRQSVEERRIVEADVERENR